MRRAPGWGFAIVFGTCCLATSFAVAADAKPGVVGTKPLAASSEATLAGHLQDAFDEGYVMGPKHLQEAEKPLAQARRLAAGDPRVDYVHGLILLKQSQVKAAVVRFEAILKTAEGNRYWPAWQAAIWGHLVDKQYETGLKQLDQFAALVQNAEKPDEVSEAQRAAAHWIGQLIESLTRCADSRKLHDLLVDHQVHLLDTFGNELSEAVEVGRESIREREFQLEQAAGAARQTADKEKARRRQDKNTRLEKDIEGLGKAKQDAAKSAEEWKEWIDEILAKADKQLGLLERDYKFLEQRAQSLMQSITLVGQEITVLELGLSNFSVRTANPLGAQNAQFQLQQRQNQMFGYRLDYNATVGRLSDVTQQGNLAIQQRADAIKRYESATGQLVKKNADLDKWTSRLKDQKQKLTVQAPPVKGGKPVRVDRKQQFTLKTYLPLELEVEKDRVLASFAPVQNDEDDQKKIGGK